MKDLIAYATRVAYSMSKDPEVESIANAAVLRAIRTFSFEGGSSLKRWVARITRQAVWAYWRKLKQRREVSMSGEWWEDVYDKTPEHVELPLEGEELRIVVEKHIEKWCIDVIARRHGLTVYRVKQVLREAEAKLEAMLT